MAQVFVCTHIRDPELSSLYNCYGSLMSAHAFIQYVNTNRHICARESTSTKHSVNAFLPSRRWMLLLMLLVSMLTDSCRGERTLIMPHKTYTGNLDPHYRYFVQLLSKFRTPSYCFASHANITVQAYSPLGGGSVLGDPTVQSIANAHKKSSAQVPPKHIRDEGWSELSIAV